MLDSNLLFGWLSLMWLFTICQISSKIGMAFPGLVEEEWYQTTSIYLSALNILFYYPWFY